MFKLFPLVQAVTSSYETVKQATVEVISEFSRENTVYLELRTTPKDRPGFSKKQYVQAVLDGGSPLVKSSCLFSGMDCCSRLPIVVRLLLSVDRRQTVEEARQTVQMALDDSRLPSRSGSVQSRVRKDCGFGPVRRSGRRRQEVPSSSPRSQAG